MAVEQDRESFLTCLNSQGISVRASIMRLMRYTVAFEVYNPYSILQASEVLGSMKIFVNARMVYDGRAVVRSLVNAGIYIVCEASLDDGWLDVDIFSPVNQKERLLGEFDEFLKEWSTVHEVSNEFKVVVADIQSLLVGLRGWLEQVELGIRSEPALKRSSVEEQVIQNLQGPILPKVTDLFGRFEEIASLIESKQQPLHQFYLRRQLHPLVLCAPFVYRTFQKPLGYAGDYEMVNMILRSPYEGASLFAKLLNTYFWNQPPAEAHRNRIKYLTEVLTTEVKKISRQARVAKIFNLGCGPAKEIQNFLTQDDLCDMANFTLIDFNDETLAYTNNLLSQLKQKHGRRTAIHYVQRSVSQILKDARRTEGDFPPESYDVVYCAGLFDYLTDRACKRMLEIFYGLVAPGGLLIATNVDAGNPIKNLMEYVLAWNLIYRNKEQLAALRPSSVAEEDYRVICDETSVNIFIEIRKPGLKKNGRS